MPDFRMPGTSSSTSPGADEMGRQAQRANALTSTFPELDPAMVVQLSAQPLQIPDLLDQASKVVDFSKVNENVSQMQKLEPDEQRIRYNAMPAERQRLYQSVGYTPPDIAARQKAADESWLSSALSTVGAPFAWVKDQALNLGGNLMTAMTNASDFVSGRPFRAIEASEGHQALATTALALRQARENLARQGIELDDEQARAAFSRYMQRNTHDYPLLGRGGYGVREDVNPWAQADTSRIDDQTYKAFEAEAYKVEADPEYTIDNAGNTWGRTADGEEWITPQVRVEAQNLMAGANRMGAASEGYDIAYFMASENKGLEDYLIEKKGIQQGTPEFDQEFSRLAETFQADENWNKGYQLLASNSSRYSLGRGFADTINQDPGTAGYTMTSGAADLTATLTLDPTLFAGHALKGYRSFKWGIDLGKDFNKLADAEKIERWTSKVDEIRDLAKWNRSGQPAEMVLSDGSKIGAPSGLLTSYRAKRADEMWSAAELIADANRTGDYAELGRKMPRVMPGLGSVVEEHARLVNLGEKGLVTPDAIFDFMSRDLGQRLIGQGSVWASHTSSNLYELPRVTKTGAAGRKVTTSIGKAIEFAAAPKEGSWVASAPAKPLRSAARTVFALTHQPNVASQLSLVGDDAIVQYQKFLDQGILAGIPRADLDRQLNDFIKGVSVERVDMSTDQFLRRLADMVPYASRDFDEADDIVKGATSRLREIAEDTSKIGDTDAELIRTWGDRLVPGWEGRLSDGADVLGAYHPGVMNAAGVTAEPIQMMGVGNRIALYKTFLDDFFVRTGVTDSANPKVRQWAQDLFDRMDNFRYAPGDLDVMYVGGKPMRYGLLPIAQSSVALEMPAFKELAGNINRTGVMGRFLGRVNGPMADALMSTYWKPAMLMRAGFLPRAIGEEMFAFVSRFGLKAQEARLASKAVNEHGTFTGWLIKHGLGADLRLFAEAPAEAFRYMEVRRFANIQDWTTHVASTYGLKELNWADKAAFHANHHAAQVSNWIKQMGWRLASEDLQRAALFTSEQEVMQAVPRRTFKQWRENMPSRTVELRTEQKMREAAYESINRFAFEPNIKSADDIDLASLTDVERQAIEPLAKSSVAEYYKTRPKYDTVLDPLALKAIYEQTSHLSWAAQRMMRNPAIARAFTERIGGHHFIPELPGEDAVHSSATVQFRSGSKLGIEHMFDGFETISTRTAGLDADTAWRVAHWYANQLGTDPVAMMAMEQALSGRIPEAGLDSLAKALDVDGEALVAEHVGPARQRLAEMQEQLDFERGIAERTGRPQPSGRSDLGQPYTPVLDSRVNLQGIPEDAVAPIADIVASGPGDGLIRGIRRPREQMRVMDDGSLILYPAENFGGKTYGVSFAADVDTALWYGRRANSDLGPLGNFTGSGSVVWIDPTATEVVEGGYRADQATGKSLDDVLRQESDEEIAANLAEGEALRIPAGKWKYYTDDEAVLDPGAVADRLRSNVAQQSDRQLMQTILDDEQSTAMTEYSNADVDNNESLDSVAARDELARRVLQADDPWREYERLRDLFDQAIGDHGSYQLWMSTPDESFASVIGNNVVGEAAQTRISGANATTMGREAALARLQELQAKITSDPYLAQHVKTLFTTAPAGTTTSLLKETELPSELFIGNPGAWDHLPEQFKLRVAVDAPDGEFTAAVYNIAANVNERWILDELAPLLDVDRRLTAPLVARNPLSTYANPDELRKALQEELRRSLTGANRDLPPELMPIINSNMRMQVHGTSGARAMVPPSENHRSFYGLLGDEQSLQWLRNRLSQPDRIDFIRKIATDGELLPGDVKAISMYLQQWTTERQALAVAGRDISHAGPMLPMSTLAFEDGDQVDRLARVLTRHSDPGVNFVPGFNHDRIPRYLDGLGPKAAEHVRPLTNTGLMEVGPQHAVHLEPYSGMGMHRLDSVTGPRWVDAPSTKEANVEDFATRLSGLLTDSMISPDGYVNHALLVPMLDHELTLSHIQNVSTDWLPTHVIAPKLVMEDPQGMWTKMVRYGFDKVIGPAISATVRHPMFLLGFADGLKAADLSTALMRNPELYETATRMWGRNTVSKTGEPLADFRDFWNGLDEGRRLGYSHLEAWKDQIVGKMNNLDRADIVWFRKQLRDANVFKDPALLDPNNARYIGDQQLEHLLRFGRHDEHVELTAVQLATKRAINDVVPYIDDHHVRSFFQDYARNLMPFEFAQEAFLKRWARTLVHSPEAMRRAQLIAHGFTSTSLVHKNERGESVFVIPGSESLTQMIGNAPIISSIWGGQASIPVGVPLTMNVESMLPGVPGDFQQLPSVSPLVQLPAQYLSNQFPELRPIGTALAPEGRLDRNPIQQIFPAWAARMFNAVTNHPDGQKEINSAAIGAMQMMEAEAIRLRSAADDTDNAEERQRLLDRAAELSLGESPTPEQQEHYIDNVKQWSRTLLLSRSVLGFFTPATPTPEFEGAALQPELARLLEHMPYDEALAVFLAQHPDAQPWTVYATTKDSGAALPPTEEALRWMDNNRDFLDQFTLAAPWLMPQVRDADEFSAKAYNEQIAYGMRHRKAPEEWYKDMKFAGAASVYFSSKDRYDQEYAALRARGADDKASALRKQWLTWADAYKNQHPLFAQQLTGQDRARRDATLDELRTVLFEPNAPAIPAGVDHADKMRTMIESFDAYERRLNELSVKRGQDAVRAKARLRQQFALWGQTYIAENPEVGGLWRTLIEPAAGVRSVAVGVEAS